jgi:diguanylate cyclase (GGDEF)-like protein
MEESMHRKDKEDQSEVIFNRIRTEILPLLYQAVHDDEIHFQNPNNISCWERRGCERSDCPAYGNLDGSCWQIAGTFCCGIVQGTFAEKYESCRECEVFKVSCPTLVEEIGEALNYLLFLFRKEKGIARKQMGKIEYLNKELLSSLGNLDTRNREIQELVITDKLTGLYNRQYLTTVLDDEIHRSQRGTNPLTIMMIDVDDFKIINDTFGHMYGDKMLSFLGNMLHDYLRKCDRPFRYGGEEFVVVLPDTDLTIAWVVAERIRKTFEKEQFEFEAKDGAKTVSRTISIGLAGYELGMSVSALIKRADEAMYKAKSEGKNITIRYGID